MSEVMLSDTTFESEVLKSKGLVLVDFYADWCGPCRMMAPALEKISSNYEGKVKVCKVNVDNCPQTSQHYEIQGIPMIFFFKDGEIMDSNVGFLSEENLIRKLDSLLEAK